MIKIFLVMPVREALEGSEGWPLAAPGADEISVSYTRDRAEIDLLERKKKNPDQPLTIFESTDHAIPSAPGVFKVAPTLLGF